MLDISQSAMDVFLFYIFFTFCKQILSSGIIYWSEVHIFGPSFSFVEVFQSVLRMPAVISLNICISCMYEILFDFLL